MIPFPFQAGQLGLEGGTATVTTPASYVGGTFSIDQTVSSLSLAVPGGTVDGDTIVVVLRCREDRTFTIPGGWTTHMSRAVAAGTSGTSYTRAYIISKARAGETSLAFTQSASAACSGALIVFRNGIVGTNLATDGLSSSITKANGSSLLLAVGLNSNLAVTTPPNPAFSGFTQRGYAKWSSGGDHFYGTVAETQDGRAAGAVTATMTWTGPTDQRAVWLAEIG